MKIEDAGERGYGSMKTSSEQNKKGFETYTDGDIRINLWRKRIEILKNPSNTQKLPIVNNTDNWK